MAQDVTSVDPSGRPLLGEVSQRPSILWNAPQDGASMRGTVLLLHAFPFDERMWDRESAWLVEAGFRVGRVRAPGFGIGAADPPVWSIEGFAQSLREVLAEFPARSVHLLGCSMGGYIALAVARGAPAALGSMVLVDTRAEADSPEAKAGRELSLDRVRTQGVTAQVEASLPKLLGRSTQATRPDLVEIVRGWGCSQSAAAVLAGLIALRDRGDSVASLSKIAVPTLVLVGAEDELTPPSAAAVLAQGIPGAQWEVIPHAGHLANLEQPLLFESAVRRFLETVAPSR